MQVEKGLEPILEDVEQNDYNEIEKTKTQIVEESTIGAISDSLTHNSEEIAGIEDEIGIEQEIPEETIDETVEEDEIEPIFETIVREIVQKPVKESLRKASPASMYKGIIILHEDNHIMVVVKPNNMPTQADSSNDLDVLTALKQYIKEKYDKQGNVFLGLVHRLDRPTGGVMVFAKTSKAAERLSESMKSGDFEKKYLAVVRGIPKHKADRLVHYLYKNERKNIVQVAPMTTTGAKYAELNYRTLTTLEDISGPLSLILIKLVTGRSHQARVQMASMGTPILGDQKYNTIDNIKCNLALWAVELKFTHPTLKEKMTFRVYPPTENAPWSAYDLDTYLKINIRY